MSGRWGARAQDTSGGKSGRWGGRARDEKDPKTGRELRKDITPTEKERLAKFGSMGQPKSYRNAMKKYQYPLKYPGVGPKGRVA